MGVDPGGKAGVYHLLHLELLELHLLLHLHLGVVRRHREGWCSSQTKYRVETLLVEGCNIVLGYC